MKTVLRILKLAGGYRRNLHLRIENPPYQPLVIEATPYPGPLGIAALSVAHYSEQNGELMRDPEMCFELSRQLGLRLNLVPFCWRNDYLGIEQYSRANDGKHYLFRPELYAQHQDFAELWDTNLRVQGFVEAFDQVTPR